MRTHSLSHTHILPCTQACRHTHLLIYTHAHTPCTCIPMHTRAHRCRHACKHSQSLFSPAESSGSCLAPGHVLCQRHVLAHRRWLLTCSSALAGEMQHMFKESGQQRNKLCLTFFQPQRPSPRFSSWRGVGGGLHLFSTKYERQDPDGKRLWRTGLPLPDERSHSRSCWPWRPTQPGPGKDEEASGWAVASGTPPPSQNLSFPVCQGVFGLDVLSDTSVLKLELAPHPSPPRLLQADASIPGLPPAGSSPSPSYTFTARASRNRQESPSSCMWTLLGVKTLNSAGIGASPRVARPHEGGRQSGTTKLWRPGWEEGQPPGTPPTAPRAQGHHTTRRFHSQVRPRGNDNGRPHENVILLSTAALLTMAKGWREPKRPSVGK